MVGSTISMECTPHVQSYTMAFNATAALFVVKYWSSKIHAATGSYIVSPTVTNVIANIIARATSDSKEIVTKINSDNYNKDKMIHGNVVLSSTSLALDHSVKQQLIADLEVGVSTALLSQGFPLIALDPHTHTRKFQQQLRLSIQLAQTQARLFHTSPSPSIQCDVRRNPVACRGGSGSDTGTSVKKPSLGCRGVDPCRVMFVKYGGEILEQDLVGGYFTITALFSTIL